MAVSKTQSERPALIELVDAVNDMGDVNERFDTLTRSLSATNAQVLALTEEVDDFSRDLAETNTNVDALAGGVSSIIAQLENIRYGMTVAITVPANDSYAGTCVYSEPFSPNSNILVIPGFADAPSPATLSLALIDSTYSDFSYSITNTGTDPATCIVGYLAIAAIPLS